jgi:hypothetical protein
VSARVTRLETSLDVLKESLGNLTVEARSGNNAVRSDIENLRRELGQIGRPNYQVWIGSAALAVAIAGGIGGCMSGIGMFAINNINARIDRECKRLHHE